LARFSRRVVAAFLRASAFSSALASLLNPPRWPAADALISRIFSVCS